VLFRSPDLATFQHWLAMVTSGVQDPRYAALAARGATMAGGWGRCGWLRGRDGWKAMSQWCAQ